MILSGKLRKRNPWDLAGAWGQFDPSNPDYEPPGAFAPSQFPQETPPTSPQRDNWMNGGKFTVGNGIGLALGAVGDALATRNGGQAVAMPMIFKGLSDARDAKQAALAAQAKHQQDREDYLWQQEHKAPSPNDTERDFEFWKAHMSPEQFNAYVQNKADPPQYRQGADGQFYRISPSTPPAAPVGRLTPLPGGPSQPATDDFRNSIPFGNPLDPRLRRYRR